jgi:hypothetical protein
MKRGRPNEGGVSFLRELECGKVRFLGWVRFRVSLGGRSTCVESLLRFSRLDSRGLVSYGSYFPLGQEKKG